MCIFKIVFHKNCLIFPSDFVYFGTFLALDKSSSGRRNIGLSKPVKARNSKKKSQLWPKKTLEFPQDLVSFKKWWKSRVSWPSKVRLVKTFFSSRPGG